MKYYIYTVLLLLLTASCSDDVQKWDQWPEWKLASPPSSSINCSANSSQASCADKLFTEKPIVCAYLYHKYAK